MRLITISMLLWTVTACDTTTRTPIGGDDDEASADADPGRPDAAEPGRPDASGDSGDDPGQPGDFAIHHADATVTTSLGSAAVTVYSPSGDGGATAAAGPFPLVVVSTGFQIGRGNYRETCEHLASWGYVVLIHDYTAGNHQEKAAEVGELIDWALGGSSGVAARIDPTRIAVAGHSLGGKVSILAGIEDDRIDAVVGWDPVDALPPFGSDGSASATPERIDELDVPLAVLGETTDGSGGFGGMSCAPAADNYRQFFDHACAAPSALEVTIAGADHTDWVDDRGACGFACQVCQNGATADATVLTLTWRVTVAWLETHLRGATGFGEVLSAPGGPATVRSIVAGCP